MVIILKEIPWVAFSLVNNISTTHIAWCRVTGVSFTLGVTFLSNCVSNLFKSLPWSKFLDETKLNIWFIKYHRILYDETKLYRWEYRSWSILDLKYKAWNNIQTDNRWVFILLSNYLSQMHVRELVRIWYEKG